MSGHEGDEPPVSSTAVTDRIAVVQADGSPGPRRCRRCPTDNHPDRLVCVRCGADLDTGDLLSLPETSEPVVGHVPVRAGGWLPTWWVPLVGALAVTVVLLLGLAVAGIGPWAPDRDVDVVAFDPEDTAAARVLLELSDVAAATTAADDGARSFVPQNMADEDPSTAWRSDGTAAGELVEVVLDEPAWVEMIVLRNGDQHDAAAYEDVGRVRQAVVSFDDGSEYLVYLVDQGLHAQAVELPAPVLTRSVRIEVLTVFEGARDGVAISDVDLRGRASSGSGEVGQPS
ncbi:MAG: discoidin domain-containing protein [Nitriliruptoraceae bacterium]